MNEFILIVVIWAVSAYSGSRETYPIVSMQEFGDKDACVFAGKSMLRAADNLAGRMTTRCVPKHSTPGTKK